MKKRGTQGKVYHGNNFEHIKCVIITVSGWRRVFSDLFIGIVPVSLLIFTKSTIGLYTGEQRECKVGDKRSNLYTLFLASEYFFQYLLLHLFDIPWMWDYLVVKGRDDGTRGTVFHTKTESDQPLTSLYLVLMRDSTMGLTNLLWLKFWWTQFCFLF